MDDKFTVISFTGERRVRCAPGAGIYFVRVRSGSLNLGTRVLRLR